jgi:hypothetical protein
MESEGDVWPVNTDGLEHVLYEADTPESSVAWTSELDSLLLAYVGTVIQRLTAPIALEFATP